MADYAPAVRAVNLPAELVAKMEELKQDREKDRGRSVEEIVQELCQEYVTVREMQRRELAHADEINRSYEERPNDWDDADDWAEFRGSAEERS